MYIYVNVEKHFWYFSVSLEDKDNVKQWRACYPLMGREVKWTLQRKGF